MHDETWIGVEADVQGGAFYRFAGIPRIVQPDGTIVWQFPPATYRCLSLALDYRTRQQKVVYQGVDGADKGKCFIACLSDWQHDFTRMVEGSRSGEEGRCQG